MNIGIPILKGSNHIQRAFVALCNILPPVVDIEGHIILPAAAADKQRAKSKADCQNKRNIFFHYKSPSHFPFP